MGRQQTVHAAGPARDGTGRRPCEVICCERDEHNDEHDDDDRFPSEN